MSTLSQAYDEFTRDFTLQAPIIFCIFIILASLTACSYNLYLPDVEI